ncbi:hypothetical protein MPSEU_000325200 [Mayamaea pseudoterrestris]|nr:hypothetical protein MPSEU_000325200 [Mayamaea pseudoterrestris]
MTTDNTSEYSKSVSSMRNLSGSDNDPGFAPFTRSSINNLIPFPSTVLSPTDRLLTLLRRRHWEAALVRILSHAQDVRFRNGHRATPLHVALHRRAPHTLIAIIVDVYPVALLLQDAQGWTPLHVNILYGSCENTTLLLIQRGGPMAASLHGSFVGSPLHLLCRHGPMSTIILRALVETQPLQVTLPNETGMLPANLLYRAFVKRHGLAQRDNVETLVAQLMVMAKAVYGCKKESTTRTASVVNNSNDDYSLLHQAILFQYHYARETNLVGHLLELHPHLVHARDDNGRNGLHAALSVAHDAAAAAGAIAAKSTLVPVSHDPLLVLLAHDPLAAAEPDPVTRRLPLFTALATCNHHGSRFATLVQAYPGALLLKDPVTGLHAYQLAAVANGSGDDDERGSNICLNTVFELLKACPSVIR